MPLLEKQNGVYIDACDQNYLCHVQARSLGTTLCHVLVLDKAIV